MTVIANLWFNCDYSPVEIAQAMGYPIDQIVKVVDLLGKLKSIIAQGMLTRVKEALDL